MKFKKTKHPSTSWTVSPSILERQMQTHGVQPDDFQQSCAIHPYWSDTNEREELNLRWTVRYLIQSKGWYLDYSCTTPYENPYSETFPDDSELVELLKSAYKELQKQFPDEYESKFLSPPKELSDETIQEALAISEMFDSQDN